METLFGVLKKTSGRIFISGKEVHIHNPKDAIDNHISLLTEDRKFNGSFLPLSVRVNIVIASVSKLCKGFLIKRKIIDSSAGEMRDALAIKTPSLEQVMGNLSGGNQQKVLVARWLLTQPDILIIDEPTRGIDVGAKSEIHKLLTQLAREGKGIIMISSELPEILGMSDRVMVMSEGRLVGILDRKDATQEKILLYATGQTEENQDDRGA
jgi:ABC-type sugar transport system ATPase subunit